MNIVFLYTEIAEYFLACCRTLAKEHQVKIHIIRYPVNNEAPFQFNETDNDIVLYNRKNYSKAELLKLVQSIHPTKIICSGWIDKEYLSVCKFFYTKIPTVLTMDTHWRGDAKQQLATLISPFLLRNKFSHVWVPGSVQKQYALKLGFPNEKISTGFYSCDVKYFSSIYEKIIEQKKQNFPKRFIFVGRYYDFKGVDKLWQAFIELQNETRNEWELWCLGTGSLQPMQHPNIKHFGFVQPKQFLHYAQNTGVFVMPSLFEPWGVVLHEFAAMGFPMIVSNKVGAAEAFLQDGKNGFIFNPEDKTALKEKLKAFMQMPQEQLNLMSEQSYQLSKNISPEKWANTLMKMN